MLVDPSGSTASVTGAIRQAARATGADFQYLLATAQVESSLNPNAKVSTSSARGLFQFIDQTWLATLNERGPALGYAPYANAIARLPSGAYAVTDPRMYRVIMNLRTDPTANALMAGAYTRLNAEKLAGRLGRHPSEGELYIAHFLGAAGAGRLVELAGLRPSVPAAAVFPGAARANPTIFYDRQGRPRGAGEVYRLLVGRYDGARARPPNSFATARASTGELSARRAFAPVAALVGESDAAARSLPAPRGQPGPVFYSLFRTDARREAVAPVVSALWGAPKPASAENSSPTIATGDGASAGRGGTLDLFQERLPDARALFRGRG